MQSWKLSPMTNTKYQAVREAVIAANPEIMELKFGCRVEAIYGLLSNSKGMICEGDPNEGIVISHDFSLFDCYRTTQHREIDTALIFHEKEKFKILGRPIRLADVMIALAQIVLPDDEFLCVFPEGFICHKREASDDNNEYVIKNARWIFRQDDLSLQSPETIDFLHSVLVSKS